MNKLDKTWFKALRFFADNNRQKIDHIRNETPTLYASYISPTLEQTFIQMGYLDFKGDTRMTITQDGLEQLRSLEVIHDRGKSFWMSLIALIISVLALAKSMGWLEKWIS